MPRKWEWDGWLAGKLNLTKLHAEVVRLEQKPKSSLASPPKPRRKQNKPKLAYWVNYKKVDTF